MVAPQVTGDRQDLVADRDGRRGWPRRTTNRQ